MIAALVLLIFISVTLWAKGWFFTGRFNERGAAVHTVAGQDDGDGPEPVGLAVDGRTQLSAILFAITS